MKRLAFIGAGSHSDAVLPFVDNVQYEFVGYFDDRHVGDYNGYPVLDKISKVEAYLDAGEIDCIFITIGDNDTRMKIFERLKFKFYNNFINVLAATVLDKASISGRNIFIGFNSFIGAKVTVCSNCIVNTGSVIEHHSYISEHCNVAPNACINGNVFIGKMCYVGSSATVIQNISVVDSTVLGASSTVVKDIDCSGVYMGVPARFCKEL